MVPKGSLKQIGVQNLPKVGDMSALETQLFYMAPQNFSTLDSHGNCTS